MKLKKNNSRANELRTAGNEHYKSSRFFEAMVLYNESLCHATPGGKEFSMGFANRSAVYMETKEYELCLENIQLAIDCGYPEDRIKTLFERQEKCLDMIEVHELDPNENPWTFFKLSHVPKETIPFVVNCIELRQSETFGRHLITTKNLRAGEIICIEEPFSKFIINESRFTHCANCLKSEKLNLFPCCECNYTMFCSKECMNIAARFHKLECQVIDVDPEMENDVFQVAHRAVLEALGILGRIEKLQHFFTKHTLPQTIFDFDLAKSSEAEKEKNLLQAVSSLQRNSVPEKLESLLNQHIELMKSITTNAEQQKFLGELMRRQVQIIITNSFGLTTKQGGDFGSGVFPLTSYFNHSCAPNISRVAVDNKLAFVVSRPVEENQQLFVCYRGDFPTTSKAERQEEILRSYRFQCACEACSRNFPLIDDLPLTDAGFVVPPKAIESVESAKAELKTNCDYINEYSKSYPNFEICTLMERNQLLLEAIAQVTPFSH